MTERLVVRASEMPIRPEDLPREASGESEATVPVMTSPGAEESPRAQTPTGRHIVKGSEAAERLWNRLINGEDFWTVVHQPFKAHELTRDDLAALIDRGLAAHARQLSRAARDLRSADVRLQALPRVPLPAELQPAGGAVSQRQGVDSRQSAPRLVHARLRVATGARRRPPRLPASRSRTSAPRRRLRRRARPMRHARHVRGTP